MASRRERPLLDPLKILYCLVMSETTETELTAFQGFSRDWLGLLWAMRQLCGCPADVLEPSQPQDGVIAQRIGGARQLAALPLSIDALEQASAQELANFWVLFACDADIAGRVDAWAAQQPIPVLHVRPDSADADLINVQWHRRIGVHCKEVFLQIKDSLAPQHRDAAEAGLAAWSEPTMQTSPHPALGHNIFLPNQMALARAFRAPGEIEGWVGETEADYARRAVESAEHVLNLREAVGWRAFHHLLHPPPGLILTEPALYRAHYKRQAPEGPFAEKATANAMRRFQTQEGLCNTAEANAIKALAASTGASAIVQERSGELLIQAFGVGLRAASTCSATLRLRPAVNRVFPKLANFARSIRSEKPEARLKIPRLFEDIQRDLADAVGPERLEFISASEGPLKLVSDAPLEWLPIGDLPLGIVRDCSRINVTPGNLMMAELATNEPITLSPELLRDVLVISGFADDDPVRPVLRSVLENWSGPGGVRLRYIYRRATSAAEFVEALDGFKGGILVFDGHGAGNYADPVGGLMMGREKVDVWSLRGKVRVPPIVLLSACDTHALDGSTHATVGNGFLFMGARTVLATNLIIGGVKAAVFIARLLYRLSDYLKPALAMRGQVLTWTEVVSGMIRMSLVTEMLDDLIGSPGATERHSEEMRKLQVDTTEAIHTDEKNWYPSFIAALAELRQDAPEKLALRARRAIARSDSVRYVQLGNPELILIDDGSIASAVLGHYGVSQTQQTPLGGAEGTAA